MKVFHGRPPGAPSELRTDHFTGTVWADPVMPTMDNVTVNTVFFAAGARTHWHAHQHGQMLQVTSGSGYVCLDGEEPRVIRPGDVVWIAPGERHWHGASASSCMVHVATSIGRTGWQEPVSEEDYGAASAP